MERLEQWGEPVEPVDDDAWMSDGPAYVKPEPASSSDSGSFRNDDGMEEDDPPRRLRDTHVCSHQKSEVKAARFGEFIFKAVPDVPLCTDVDVHHSLSR